MAESPKNDYTTPSFPSHHSNSSKKCLVSIGICSRFYLYILAAGSFKLFSLIILGAKGFFEDGIGLFGFCPVFYDYNFIQSIYMYIGYIIFGIIFLNVMEIKIEENINAANKYSYFQELYRVSVVNSNEKDNTNWKIAFLCLAIVAQVETKKVLYIEGFQFFNFWVLEIIFMQILMRIYFTIDVYIHHKVAIFFNVTVCSAILITASFLPTSLSNDNQGNSYQNTKNKFGSYFYCILIILFFMVISFIFCFTRIYSKVLMQIKFVSPYKLILCFGITGFIISLSCSLVAYNINYRDNLFNYFSALRSSLDEGKKYKFYGEIFLASPLYAFTTFMEFTFEILTIYYLNPFYILLSNTLYYGITEFLFFVLNSSSDTLVIFHFILTELAEIITAFGHSIYLEIIEFHICGLDNNLRKMISKKGEDEFIKIFLNDLPGKENDDDDDEDIVDNVEDDNTKSKEDKYFGNINKYNNI